MEQIKKYGGVTVRRGGEDEFIPEKMYHELNQIPLGTSQSISKTSNLENTNLPIAMPFRGVKYTSKEGERIIGVVKSPITQADMKFYQSSGSNSGHKGTWFPYTHLSSKIGKPNDVRGGNCGQYAYVTEKFSEKILAKYIEINQDSDFNPKEDISDQIEFETLGRFGNSDILMQSILIGGGYWDSAKGKQLADFIKTEIFPSSLKDKQYLLNVTIIKEATNLAEIENLLE